MKNTLSLTNRMYKILQNLIADVRYLFGLKKIVLNPSDIDGEFLNNFDNIGDYKRVLPSQTRLNIEYSQTNICSDQTSTDKRDIYIPPIHSFSGSSPCTCFSQCEVLTKNSNTAKSFLSEFKAIHLSEKTESIVRPDNFIYVKCSNGFVENWCSNKKHENEISLNECAQHKNDPLSSYFNMHKLYTGESKRPGSVLLFNIYLS